ncbi:MAG: SDR family NAD(P)-dependent oxidoreductase, partial [Tannerellaceae bacterium]|nr:SDR family NAD(P)-dependent oxidoreductase [Tannerellaceae bacterium]
MKYALVTGGSRGIGRSICLQLAGMGYPLLINYRSNKEAAECTQSLIEEKGGTAELLPFDVANGEETDNVLTGWLETHPDDSVAVLVNNAGLRLDNMMIFMQNAQWHQVMDTTMNGFFYVTRRLLKDMLTNRWGRIINISSLSGIKGLPGQTNYSAAKAALIGASKALAQEV